MTGAAPDPHRALTRAILAGLDPASATIESDSQTPWASATFCGARHQFAVTVAGDDAVAAAARLSRMINEDRVLIAGHIIADIVLECHQLVQSLGAPHIALGIEALTVSAA